MTDDELSIDFETRSPVDLKKAGAHAYFEHPDTDIWCCAYSFNGEEPELWVEGDSPPTDVLRHVAREGTITAWNAAFERLAWREILHKRFGWHSVNDRQWRCTMTESLAMNMPGMLDKAGPAFKLPITKDKEGHRLMLKMSRPRKRKNIPGLHWWDDQDHRLRLGNYCKQDVRVETAIARKVLRIRPSEREIYYLDMQINDRGVFIDAPLCYAAAHIVDQATARLDKKMAAITDNQVRSVTEAAGLIRWLNSCLVQTDSVDREAIEDLLIRDDLPTPCRMALELRYEGSKVSTAKINAMLTRRQEDGRMRGNLQMYGAGPGRWAARGAQLQNLTRPQILGSKKSEPTPLDEQIDNAIKSIYTGSHLAIELTYGPPLTLVADCVRSMVCAPKGRILRASDFSNIEGRGVAWEAGQEDKLEAFRAFDRSEGPDLYLVAAAGIFNLPVNDAKPYRQIGKVAELALGYQGGPRAFAKMAKGYGLRIANHHGPIWELASDEHKLKVEEAWGTRGCKTGMSKKAWSASEVIKMAWRQKNWKIEQLWYDVENAAVQALQKPGQVISVACVKFRHTLLEGGAHFLFCQLPSGRTICYPWPRLERSETSWGAEKLTVIYKSQDQFTKKWEDKAYYGGLGVENITQAIARDIMAEAMVRVEKAGYPVVLTVHDEIVVETDKAFGSLEEYNLLMTELPAWATGFPISAGGWAGARYRKN